VLTPTLVCPAPKLDLDRFSRFAQLTHTLSLHIDTHTTLRATGVAIGRIYAHDARAMRPNLSNSVALFESSQAQRTVTFLQRLMITGLCLSQISFIELCKTLRTNSGSRAIIADCWVWTHPHFYTDLRPWLWRALQNISGVGGWRKVALGITSVKGFVQYSICCSINSEYTAFPIVGNSWRHLLTVHRPSQTQIVHKFLALFLICLSFTIGHFHTYFAKNAAYIIFPFNSWISFQRQCRLLWG